MYVSFYAPYEEGWTKPGIFEDCPVLSKVTIGRNAGYIPMRTFIGCEALSEVVFEERSLDTDAALTIGEAAFVRCNLDGELSFPNGLDAIGEDAFNNNNISAIELPSTCRRLAVNLEMNALPIISLLLYI